MSLELIEGYIRGKLCTPTAGRPSEGISRLRDHGVDENPELLGDMCEHVFSILAEAIAKDGNPKLTQVSSRVGGTVGNYLELRKMPWKAKIPVGDLFIEAFYVNEYINIWRTREDIEPKKVEEKDGKKKYKAMVNWDVIEEGGEVTAIENRLTGEIILAEDFEENNILIFYKKVTVFGPTKKWKEEFGIGEHKKMPVRLTGTVFDKPADVFDIMQRHPDIIAYPIVKGWHPKKNRAMFNSIRNASCMQGINHLQQTPWRINTKVLEAVEAQRDLIVSPEVDEDEFEEARRVSKEFELDITIKKANLIGDRKFYSLFDFDYRGRIYNRETVFNFQGSDTARGLFLFDRAKPVDERGFDWMCIHAACSYNMSYKEIPEWCEEDYATHLQEEGLENISVDKMTLQDRINWTLNHLTEIQMTAELNVINANAEKPVSYLAVCHEINNYLKGFKVSALPIPIDGSNNGWQHLGAISKDTRTGELVGLVPVNIQNDFYVQTAKRLIAITKDERRAEILKAMPMKKIRKAISKRGSMTRAYSAGAQKIAENMLNDLRKDDLDKEYGIDVKMCMGFARDLVKAIELTCTGPLETMKYLQKIAAEIVEFDDCMKWVTPSGFLVEYRKYHMRSDQLKTTIKKYGAEREGGVRQFSHRIMVPSDNVDKRGFACGVSPNYIHSLDASHMALVLKDWEGAFGAVHDSFSTHASEVDDLLLLTKETFISMYDHENYFDKIQQSIMNKVEYFISQPTLGDMDIKEVMESDYFFA